MAELEELEQEGLDEDLLKISGTASLPNVPSTELPATPGMSFLGCHGVFFRFDHKCKIRGK